MADSVSEQDVEDMLSSVRRLVSNEMPKQNQRARLSDGASALVLTEAQRIAPQSATSMSRGMTLEERIAELEAAVNGQPDDWEPDGSEDASEHRPTRIVYKPTEQTRGRETSRPLRLTEIALIETGPANEDKATGEEDISDETELVFEAEKQERETPTAAPKSGADTFADAIARDVAAVVAEMSQTARITETDFNAALAEAVRDPAETRRRAVSANEASIPEETASPMSEEEPDPEGRPPLSESGDVEGKLLDQVAERSETTVEAGGFDAMSEADFAPAFTDENGHADTEEEVSELRTPDEIGELSDDASQEAPVTAEKVAKAEEAARAPIEARSEDDADVTSEGDELLTITRGELHRIVATIIREELQSDLGERITRNVRKLVRQEIHRALSVRELE